MKAAEGSGAAPIGEMRVGPTENCQGRVAVVKLPRRPEIRMFFPERRYCDQQHSAPPARDARTHPGPARPRTIASNFRSAIKDPYPHRSAKKHMRGQRGGGHGNPHSAAGWSIPVPRAGFPAKARRSNATHRFDAAEITANSTGRTDIDGALARQGDLPISASR